MCDLLTDRMGMAEEGRIYTAYDMAMGTSQMLTCMEERLSAMDKAANLICYGQEINPFTFGIAKADMLIPKPKSLDKMLQMAASLSEGFPQVRVDLYEVNVGLVSGENDFFMLSRDTVEKWGLEDAVMPIIGRSEQVKGIILSPEEHLALQNEGKRVFISAVSDGPETGVVIRAMDEKFWKEHYFSSGRILPASKDSRQAEEDAEESVIESVIEK